LDYAIAGTGIDKKIDAKMYGARVTTAWDDIDNDKNIDDNEFLTETIKLYSRDGNLALESPSGLNKEGMEAWAEAYAKEILAVIFPSGLTSGVGVMNHWAEQMSFKKQQTDAKVLNNDFKAVLEYLFIDVNDNDGGAASIMLGYGHEADNGLEFGFKLPYRYTSIDDGIDSESHYAGLDFYGKYPVKKWNDMAWNIGLDIFGSGFYLRSDAIEHSGNLEYGGGIFTSFTKDFKFLAVTAGIDYNISKAYFKTSFVDSDDGFVESALDYINDLDPVHALSYGFNVTAPFAKDKAAVSLEVIRSNFLSDDIESDRDAQTIAGLSCSYFPTDSFELNLGIRQTFELDDINTTGIMLGAVFKY